MVVMFHKVTTNTELANAEPLFPGGSIGLSSYELLVTIFLSRNPYITLFCVCFCLKTSHLIRTVGSSTLNSCLNEAHLPEAVSPEGLATASCTQAATQSCAGGHFKQQKHQRKAQKY